jgi:uncharacterized protein (DUF1684 family)
MTIACKTFSDAIKSINPHDQPMQQAACSRNRRELIAMQSITSLSLSLFRSFLSIPIIDPSRSMVLDRSKTQANRRFAI